MAQDPNAPPPNDGAAVDVKVDDPYVKFYQTHHSYKQVGLIAGNNLFFFSNLNSISYLVL